VSLLCLSVSLSSPCFLPLPTLSISLSFLKSNQDLLKNIDGHKKAFHEIHGARSVNGVPVPPDQLEDMAER